MAIARGATATGGRNDTGAALTITCNQPTTSPDTVALVGVNISVSSSSTSTSCTVTYGGIPMTQLAFGLMGSTTERSGYGLYMLCCPPTGLQDIVVTPAGSSTKSAVAAGGQCYTGVGGFANGAGAGTTGKTVTTVANGAAFVVTTNGAALSAPTQTSVYLGGNASAAGAGDYISVQDALTSGASTVFANTGTATVAYCYGVALLPVTSDIRVVGSAYAAIATSRSPVVDFTASGYVPAENDMVLAFPSSTTTATVADIADWTNMLGSTTDIESASGAHELSCAYHIVTAAEETAVTTSWTLTNWYDATEIGNVAGIVLRDTTAAGAPTVDDVGSWGAGGSAATPHVLAGLTGANLSDNSLVVSTVAKDGTGLYASQPTDWMFRVGGNDNQGKALLSRNALTTATVDVAATNITPSASDEGLSITVAVAKATGMPPNTTNFFAMF